MSTIKVGIIGQGRSGRNIHAHYLSHLSDRYTIVAVSDGLEERRASAIRDFGCNAYADYRDMLRENELDLVVNATPSQLHVPVTLELLEAGFNVLCEKPLARRAADADRLIEAAEKSGARLAVYQQSRFNRVFRQLRQVLDSGVLGRIVQISITASNFSRRWDWQTLKSHNGGTLLNTGAHYVHQALLLLGDDAVPDVWCRMDSANSFGDAEDYCKIVLDGGGSKPAIDIELSCCNAYPAPTYVVQGTNGGLRASAAGTMEWKYFKPEEAPAQQVDERR